MDRKRKSDSEMDLLHNHMRYLRGELVKRREEVKSSALRGDKEAVLKGIGRLQSAMGEMSDYLAKNKNAIPNETERRYFVHDFNNKMSAISGRTDIMLMNKDSMKKVEGKITPPKGHEKLADMDNALNALDKSLESMRNRKNHMLFDVKDALKEYKPFTYCSDAKVEIRCESMPITGDPHEIIRAIDNMVTNAS
jgi:signal transduction histidine kinase